MSRFKEYLEMANNPVGDDKDEVKIAVFDESGKRITFMSGITREEFNHFSNTPNFKAKLLIPENQLKSLKIDEDDLISIEEVDTFK